MLNLFSLALDNENYGSSPARYIERFIGSIEHQNLTH